MSCKEHARALPLDYDRRPHFHDQLTGDLFAGGGGATLGVELGTGRQVDFAINHDAAAVAMHAANHPNCQHWTSDVFEVDPHEVTQGRPVGLLWLSPDCTHHSKARGSKPLRLPSQKRRALAWVGTRWAGQVRPRLMIGENVEEFAYWGPLRAKRCPITSRVIKIDGTVAAKGERVPIELQQLVPCPAGRARSFKRWVRSLRRLGYDVEWKELRACDYGTPTIRKRLFIIARCDGEPIVWPKPTHAAPCTNCHGTGLVDLPEGAESCRRCDGHGVPGGLLPFRTAASCIDWSIPMLSIFATKAEAREFGKRFDCQAPQRPLAENTNRRNARGVKRFVLDNPRPFLVSVAHGDRWKSGPEGVRDLDLPLPTITATGNQAVSLPCFSKYYGTGTGQEVTDPAATLTTKERLSIVAPVFVPRYGEAPGQEPRCRSVEEPLPTIVTTDNGALLTAAHLEAFYGDKGEDSPRGGTLDAPIHTIPTENRHALVMSSFLGQNNGGFFEGCGRPVEEPISTILSNGRGHQPLFAVNMVQSNYGDTPFSGADDPLRTIVAGGTHHAVLASHIQRDFGESVGSPMDAPIGTITGGGGGKAALVGTFMQKYLPDGGFDLDANGYVTKRIGDGLFVLVDIFMRMLRARELYRCQGFPDWYVIDRGVGGEPITATDQVHMCGNSVPPQFAEVLSRANATWMILDKPERELVAA